MSNKIYLFDLELGYSRKLTFFKHNYKGLLYVDIAVYRRRYGNFKPVGDIVSIPLHKLEVLAEIFTGMVKSMKGEIERHKPGGRAL